MRSEGYSTWSVCKQAGEQSSLSGGGGGGGERGEEKGERRKGSLSCPTVCVAKNMRTVGE